MMKRPFDEKVKQELSPDEKSSSSSSRLRPVLEDDLELNKDGRYLCLYNISKLNNVRNMCITAAAFGYSVVLVGEAHKTLEDANELGWATASGEQGLKVQRTSSLANLSRQLVAHGIPLYGIEIMDEAKSIADASAVRAVPRVHALMPGNEGSGLNAPQKRASTDFLYIPQYGHGTASLNVNVAIGIVMHTIAYPIDAPC